MKATGEDGGCYGGPMCYQCHRDVEIQALQNERDEAIKTLRKLYSAVEMDQQNEAIRHGKKGKAWNGDFVRREILEGSELARGLLAKYPQVQS